MSVGIIEPLGILNASITKNRRMRATATATPIDSAYSRSSPLRHRPRCSATRVSALAWAVENLSSASVSSRISASRLSSALVRFSRSLRDRLRLMSSRRLARMRRASTISWVASSNLPRRRVGRSVRPTTPEIPANGRTCRNRHSTMANTVKNMIVAGTCCSPTNRRTVPTL